jgi:hypothetical protein
VDYVVFPEYEMVRSNVVAGSMAVSHQPQLIALHAVVRDDSGKLSDRTECGQLCRFDPQQVEFRTWDQINPMQRCQLCVDTAGGALVGPDGKRYYP